MTNYEYDELMLQFEQMRAQGLNPQLCDTPVPYYDGRVPCGVPTDAGDIVRGDYVMMPLEVAELDPIYTLTVRGDSMKDAGIASGDELRVLATPMADDGEIVVALVDGEYTVKMLFTDDLGRRWLVPRNTDYQPLLITEEMDVRIMGRVLQIVKAVRRVPYATLVRAVNRAMAQKAQEEQAARREGISDEQLTALLAEVYGEAMASASDWIAVYRVLCDKCGAPISYKGFSDWVNALAPEGYPRCTADLLRKADAVYLRPVFEWTPDLAPSVRISVLDRRTAIAKRLMQALSA